jgi:HEPN domain-containing protein
MVRKRKHKVPDNVCFCAQQCIEKYLKAFLVFHHIGFPKTHALEALLDFVVHVEPALESIRSELNILQPYAIDVRYPGFSATIEESKDAVKIMKRLRTVLRQHLGLSLDT